MWVRLEGHLKQLSLARRFMLASLIILVAGMIGIGQWVAQQIEAGVVHRTAATTALYVDSFITPQLQELAQAESLTPEHIARLDRLLRDTPLGHDIVVFKVWGPQGHLLYSTDSTSIGQVFPVPTKLARAWQGQVAAGISDLTEEENAEERQLWPQLLEIYSPVRLHGTDQIVAVAEFYQIVGDLQGEISAARRESWLVVGMAMLVMYLLLAGFVRRASDTIVHQQRELSGQVDRLTDLLAQNQDLHERVRGAAVRATALNERFLHRISAELHDGPAQDLGLALLRLDHVFMPCAACRQANVVGQPNEELAVIQSSLHHALREMRAIAAGLVLPQLGALTLAETLAHVTRAHERRTGTKVRLNIDALPEQAPLPLKITLYRLVQEALNNAYCHAGGVGQQVHVSCPAGQLSVAVMDQGAGFDGSQLADRGEHLGLSGMRERVEILGGVFRIESNSGRGTSVSARLPLQVVEDYHER